MRPDVEFNICHLPGSISAARCQIPSASAHVTIDVPLVELVANPQKHVHSDQNEVYFICRLGNDSQLATNAVRSVTEETSVKDLIGGLKAWTREVDPNFPVY